MTIFTDRHPADALAPEVARQFLQQSGERQVDPHRVQLIDHWCDESHLYCVVEARTRRPSASTTRIAACPAMTFTPSRAQPACCPFRRLRRQQANVAVAIRNAPSGIQLPAISVTERPSDRNA
jgi:hypothetical protein